jgi:hypothetical protein
MGDESLMPQRRSVVLVTTVELAEQDYRTDKELSGSQHGVAVD